MLFPLGGDDDHVGEVEDLDDGKHGDDDLDHDFYHDDLHPDLNRNPNDDFDPKFDHDDFDHNDFLNRNPNDDFDPKFNLDNHGFDHNLADEDDDQHLAQYQKVLMPDHGDNAPENDQDLGFPDLTL